MTPEVMRSLVLMLLLALVGCGPVQVCGATPNDDGETVDGVMCEEMLTSTFHVSDSFTPEQIEGIVGSADTWYRATGGRVRIRFDVTPEERSTIYPVVDLPTGKKAAYVPSTGDIMVAWYLGREKARLLMAHELGHALGLGHSSDPDSLMFPTVHTDTPSPADLEAFDRLYAERM